MSQIFSLIIAVSGDNRMKSKKTKASHEICGVKIIDRLIRTARAAGSDKIIAATDIRDKDSLTDNGDDVRYIFCNDDDARINDIISSFSLLLGPDEKNCGRVFVLTADFPLVSAQTLRAALDFHIAGGNACTIITAAKSDKSAAFCVGKRKLISACMNAANISDIPAGISGLGHKVERFLTGNADEVIETSDLADLAEAEAAVRMSVNRKHMANGVVMIDPLNTYIQEEVKIGIDTVLHPGCVIEGATTVGEDCVIGPCSKLSDMTIGNGVTVKYSNAVGSEIGDGTIVGPYAYIRPGSVIGRDVKIGDFVEVKKSAVGDGTKISHLAYVGDAVVGMNVTIGCGCIFANYDGRSKHTTTVGDNAFIGSNSNLIAPVNICSGAFIAAGSTITKDVPENSFAIARVRQETKEGYMLTWKKEQGGEK